MTTANTYTPDEAQIRQLLAEKDRALCAKDLDGLMAHYATEAIFFDVKPPFQIKGPKDFRRVLEKKCLPYFPASCGTETRDLRITVSGDLALAHRLWRFTGTPEGRPAQTWIRDKVVCKRNQGKWQIVHEHGPVPFDPEPLRAVFPLEP